MQKRVRYFPEFNHIICGKPPKTTATQFEEKLRKLRQPERRPLVINQNVDDISVAFAFILHS